MQSSCIRDRLQKLQVYETMVAPTARRVCAYLLVQASLHAQPYALTLKKRTGGAIETVLPARNADGGFQAAMSAEG